MLKLKKKLAALMGMVMAANSLLMMPVTTFADVDSTHAFVFDGYTVDYEVTGGWDDNTDVVSLTLSNTGTETIENWMLYFDPHGEVTYAFDADKKATADGVTYFKNKGYNANIAPGESVTFSYTVLNCTEIPSNYVFCQARTPKASGYDVELKVNDTWGDNNEYFNGEIIIQNQTDAPIEAWELSFDTNFTITEFTKSWAADVMMLEPYCYTLKGTYTGTIYANSSVSLGFTGVMDGEPEIVDYLLTEVVADESIIERSKWTDWENMPDTDGDGLPDKVELEIIGSDPNNPDTDGDNLPDGYEIFTTGSDPTDANSLDSNISDGDYDNDQDGFTNYEEYLLGTNPNLSDSDYDGLSDGDEVNKYGTDPLNPDTDGDGISDGDEIALSETSDTVMNPLSPDSDEDGIPDGEEKIQQELVFSEDDAGAVITEVEVSFEGTGYIQSTTQIKPEVNNVFVNRLVGLIGKPFSFETTSNFSSADITFKVNCDTSLDRLGVVWYDEDYHQFRILDNSYDVENSTISVNVPHFSIYCVIDRETWMEGKGIYYFVPATDLTDSDEDKIPDCYEATSIDNPENQFLLLSNGDQFISLIGNQDSDNDTVIDGDEVVFCTVGDVNCDGIVNEEDFSLLEQYLSGASELSKIGSINADCNLDGLISADDLTCIQNYLENGLYEFNADEDLIQNIMYTMANKILGDVDGNGVRDIEDALLLREYLHGRTPFDINMYNRADLTCDNKVNIFDLVLLQHYLIRDRISIAGYSFFYGVSNPLTEDSDGDLDPDNIDPNPMDYQLNGYFAEKMGELQKAAQEYLGDFSNAKGDVYYNLKDAWLVFYYLRSLETSYTTSNWTKTSGADAKFISFVNNSPKYAELQEYFKSTPYIYANTEGTKVDLYHLSATVSSLLYYPTIKGLLPSNISDVKKFLALLLLDRDDVNEELDTLSGWGGDLQQLMNDAYKANNGNTISENIYAFLGSDGTHFTMADLYADIDAEIIANNIVNMYTGRKSFDPNKTVKEAVNNCYTKSETNRYATFSELVNLNFDTALRAAKIDLASEYDLNNSYRIFEYPDKITSDDYKQIASAFIEKLDAIFKED